MNIEGEITVTLRWDGQRVRQVALRSTRPLAAARVAIGRTPAEAAALVPSLFAICGHAQRTAAVAALRAAGAQASTLPEPGAWSVPLETVQEITWRLLVDAPRALGLAPQTAAVAAVRAAVARAVAAFGSAPAARSSALAAAATELGDLAGRNVYGCAAVDWLSEMNLPALDAWRENAATLPARALASLARCAPGLGRSDTALMPGLDDPAWLSTVAPALQSDPAFAQAPTWCGDPVETGALARTRRQPLVAALIEREGHSAATRLVARLVELAQLLDALRRAEDAVGHWVQAWPLGSGAGLAAVQSARGLLLHWVRIADGRVADYRIVAPTEWNFHPRGALVRGLAGTLASDEAALVALAGLAVHALDPCVGFHIEVDRDA